MTARIISAVEVDGSSKCASAGVERFSQHTKGKLLVFIGPAALQRLEDKP